MTPDDKRDASPRSPATVAINGAVYQKPYPPAEGASGLPAPNPEPVASAPPEPRTERSNPTVTPAPAPSDPISPASQSWGQAFEALQRNTREVQLAFQQTLTESHLAYLKTSEAAFEQLGKLAETFGQENASPVDHPMPSPPVITNNGVSTIAVSTPLPESPSQPQDAGLLTPEPLPPPQDDLQQLLVQVVAEKTGYPEDVIALDIDLEADLGIDSIKKIEILSALQERRPDLQGLDASMFASMHTFEAILQAVQAQPDEALAFTGDTSTAKTPLPSPTPTMHHLDRYIVKAVPDPPTGIAPAGLRHASPLYVV